MMLVIPQDALLMKVRGLFSTQTAFSATRPAKKVKRAGCWTTEPISRFEYDGGATVPQVAEERKNLKCCEGSWVMSYMPVRLNTTEAAEFVHKRPIVVVQK